MARNGLHWWIEQLDTILFPPRCRLCGAVTDVGIGLCEACLNGLPWLHHGCTRCGRALPDTEGVWLCGRCLQTPPAFDATTALLHYQPPVDYLIQRLKFSGELAIGSLLAHLLAAKLNERARVLPELLIPVPLHRTRLRERGFNQSMELARQLGRRLKIPVEHRLCRRDRNTRPQSLTPLKKRPGNLRGAFALHGELAFGHVALIDDVMTTGHTVNELAGVLRRGGAGRVEVWVIARSGR